MRVGVVGGGIQGCCIALALADRGVQVVLMDRNASLLSRTAVANEGKVHLGYMYAADPTLSTARAMMEGALAFAPFMRRHLDDAASTLKTSEPAAYVVHRDSQHDAGEVRDYLAQVHELLMKAAAGRAADYFGLDLAIPPREWPAEEVRLRFNPEKALAVFDSPEVAINPIVLAQAIRARILHHPRIETRLDCFVESLAFAGGGVAVQVRGASGSAFDETFDQVANAAWDGRIALDETLGLKPLRPWLHRLKYGVGFTLPDGLEVPRSATFVSGPFGEVVSYPDRSTYLTWYPSCLRALSAEVTPPAWETYPGDPLRTEILEGTLAALSSVVPCLSRVQPGMLHDAVVKGGCIVAWGDTDIYDAQSELHRRYEIGVTSFGPYHSVDPGKLTMAPFFAEQCADRIAGTA